jgi:DNA-binding winged helix-turn-helix (wHTH) protein
MTHDPHLLRGPQPKLLRFGRYVLDLGGDRLLFDGNEIALRPKTFAIMRYLVENSGRVVSKDELFAAVWPNLIVTEDALVQSVGELRRAVGADGMRFIKTIPHHGFRFEAAVSVIEPRDASATDDNPGLPASPGGVEPSSSHVTAHESVQRKRFGWRRGLLGSLVLAGLLAAGALVIGRSDWKPFSKPRSINQPAKASDIPANPAIAIVSLANQNDSARNYSQIV